MRNIFTLIELLMVIAMIAIWAPASLYGWRDPLHWPWTEEFQS